MNKQSPQINGLLLEIKNKVYDPCSLQISEYRIESESRAYQACQFNFHGARIICRNANITPKKTGQFVTFWKREQHGPIEPFDLNDAFDFFVINVRFGESIGQFVFPKALLMEKQIISTLDKEGKRGFRVYPPWDKPNNMGAKNTQRWQLRYFFSIESSTLLKQVKSLYKIK